MGVFIDHWQAECSACRLQSRCQAVRNRKAIWSFTIRCQEGTGAGQAALADRRCILDAAIRPKVVDAAGNGQR